MAQPRTPGTGSVFLDPRGDDRSLRVTWHQESQLVVLSLWRDNVCAGTWGPNAIHQLIAPHAWRLPFEREWRAKKS